MEKRSWNQPEMEIQEFVTSAYCSICEEVTVTKQNCLGSGAIFWAGDDNKFTWGDLKGFEWESRDVPKHNCNNGHAEVTIHDPAKSQYVFFASDTIQGNAPSPSDLFIEMKGTAQDMTEEELSQEVSGHGSNWWWVAQPASGWAENTINHGHFMSYTRAYNHS